MKPKNRNYISNNQFKEKEEDSMGRTVPTFTDLIASEFDSWSKFRRGLRKEDQEVFDDLFRSAKKHLAENFYSMRTIPFESIIVSLVLEQGKRIRALEQELLRLNNNKELAA
jgi:hypothetical protein